MTAVSATAVQAPAAYGVARRGAYPVLLAAVVAVTAAALRWGWDAGLVAMGFLFATIGYFAALERLIPYEPAWHPTPREWRWYGVYFLLSLAAGGLAQLPIAAAVAALAGPERAVAAALPLAAELPLALLLQSAGGYLIHRLGHTNRWLWRLHGVHHVPRKVNVANNGVNHVADVVLAQLAAQLPLALIGFSAESVFAVGLFVIAQGYFVHANVDVRIGRLNYLVGSPEQHRLHHSTDLSEAGHFGADLSIWDRAFGTFTWHPGRRPAAVGLHDPASFPDTGDILATLVQPWRPRARAATFPAPAPRASKDLT